MVWGLVGGRRRLEGGCGIPIRDACEWWRSDLVGPLRSRMAPRYEQLRAWQLAHAITLEVYRETELWPKREWYGLAAHVRKSATAIGSNLAEGACKHGVREYRRFVDIALGSFGETEYQLRLGHDLGYLAAEKFAALSIQLGELGKCLYGRARFLDRQ